MSDTDVDNTDTETLGAKSENTGTSDGKTAPVAVKRPRTVSPATPSADLEAEDCTTQDASADTENDTAVTEFTTASAAESDKVPVPGDALSPNAAAGDKKSRRIPLPSLTSRASGPRARLLLGVVVVLALVASIASSVVFYQRDHHNQRILEAQNEARDAACKYAPVLATYDAKNLDAYFTAVLDGATGDWRKQFDSTSKDLRDVLTQGQVVSKATDVQCALRSGDENSAEAIVVIGQTITSVGTQGKPAPGQLSMVMRMERSGHGWLVNKVNSPLAQQPQQ
ncbi:hypothetical protein [Nocardia sp. NBC_00511]|uniref:hypothetical protein n=1 Tax=Nocardia sp. NBC_00511 TaxID=2903591 RepID=UPI0030E0BD3C